jgi:serine/threonine protein phosphatase 1
MSTVKLMRRFDPNIDGRDFVVGDLHGCFSLLQILLAHVEFDESVDRLFSLGDLVDRGPESERVSEFLIQPWFHAIRGNHDYMLLKGAHMVEQAPVDMAATHTWLQNGGEWFLHLMPSDQDTIYFDISRLPYAMEVALPDGGIAGLIHAQPFEGSWQETRVLLDPEHWSADTPENLERLVWDRSMARRIRFDEQDGWSYDGSPQVDTVDLVYIGHTAHDSPISLGNTRWMDTNAGYEGGGPSLAELGINGRVWTVSGDGAHIDEGWNRP